MQVVIITPAIKHVNCHAGLGDCVIIGKNVLPNECEESLRSLPSLETRISPSHPLYKRGSGGFYSTIRNPPLPPLSKGAKSKDGNSGFPMEPALECPYRGRE